MSKPWDGDPSPEAWKDDGTGATTATCPVCGESIDVAKDVVRKLSGPLYRAMKAQAMLDFIATHAKCQPNS